MTSDDMIRDLEDGRDELFSAGRMNNITDVACSIFAVGGSFLAAVLAAAEVEPWIVAAGAAIPALATSLQQTVDYRGRSAWYFLKAASYDAILLRLRYSGLTVEAAAQELAHLEVSMEQRWSEFVRSSASPRPALK